jgi:hypothetical protein
MNQKIFRFHMFLIKLEVAIQVARLVIAALLVTGFGYALVGLPPQATAQLAGDTNATSTAANTTTGGMNQTTTDIIPSGSISNITGSIEIFPKIMQTLRSQMNVSLNDAITTALNAVGQNSSAISASAQTEGDFLVYRVLVLDADNNTHMVLVDPGNGDVLLNPQPLPPLVVLNPQPLPPLV